MTQPLPTCRVSDFIDKDPVATTANSAVERRFDVRFAMGTFCRSPSLYGCWFRRSDGRWRAGHGVWCHFQHIATDIGCSPRCGVSRGTYRSEEHTSELQSLMPISYAVFCLQK